MAFTDKILSWRFRHLNIVGCLLKRRPTKGGGGGDGHPRTPLATPLHHHRILATLISVTFNYKAQAILRRRSMRRLFAVKMPLCKAKKKNTRQSSTKENVTKKKTTKQTSKWTGRSPTQYTLTTQSPFAWAGGDTYATILTIFLAGSLAAEFPVTANDVKWSTIK